MKKIFLSLLVCIVALTASAQVARPKLVVGLVIDQMRWDYMYYYYDKFGEGGMKRLMAEGFSCDNQMLNYVPTITGVGHSSIYTGAVPAANGIPGNDFYLDGKRIYCTDDPTVKGVGTDSKAGNMSPKNLLGTTIGDMLRCATDFRSKVIGIALKDRASILPAGHSANAAYWYDKSVAGFITSSYYMEKLPDWVKKFNREAGMKKGYDPKSGADGVTLTFNMAEAALKNEQLGKGNYLLFLTADHGGSHNPNTLKEHKLPGGGCDMGAKMRDLNEKLKAEFGLDIKYAKDVIGEGLYLDHELLAQNKLCLEKVKAAAIRILKADPDLQWVIDYEKAAYASVPQWVRERVINGYYQGRSGDIILMPRINYFEWPVAKDFLGSSHGTWTPADTHIPLIFMGWNIKPGYTNRQTHMDDTAPTVCSLLHIQMPDACTGNPIVEVTDK